MRKNIVFVALISFMFVLSLQIAEPAAAAKMVDHGSIKGTNSYMGYHKYTWVTYQKGTNYVKSSGYLYLGIINHSYKAVFVLQKISKTKLKVTVYMNGKKIGSETRYTKLTAAQYYWRFFKYGEMLAGL